MKPDNGNDTITALSTPEGKGAIGVIRMSGPDAIRITCKLLPSLDLSIAKSHTLHFGTVKDGMEIVDEAVVGLFRSPSSFTGEDVVEISCHGSHFIISKVMSLLIKYGARTARPGEFTLRAFLNGKYDLTQAEAISDLIAAETEAAHQIAVKQMRGGFSGDLKNIRQKLIEYASLLELELDFGEEDVQFANRKELKEQLQDIISDINRLTDSFRLGNVMKRGVSAVIAGRPNAGKSTLLNALLNEQKAIVSDIPGTTRDAIESTLVIEGIAFRLTDTAGIRDTTDYLEKLGVEMTMQTIEQAHIVIYLWDAAEITTEEAERDIEKIGKNGNVKIIRVANKMDLKPIMGDTGDAIPVSAKKGEGIGKLKEQLKKMVLDLNYKEESTVVTNARHYEALVNANDFLKKGLEGLESNHSGELVSSDIRSALYYIGLITGEVTTDDLLANIFGRFCIGK